MGAFTFKPFAYQGRPWEYSQVHVFNYFRATSSEPAELVFQLRDNIQIMRIQASGWLNDKTRFVADGFRRQRLTCAQSGESSVSWTNGLALWWSSMPGRSFWGRIDGLSIFHSTPLLLYQTTQSGRRIFSVSFDTFLLSEIYHGVYGFKGLPAFTGLALPGCHPYEEEGVTLSPSETTPWAAWGLVQLSLVFSFVNALRPKKSFVASISRMFLPLYHSAGWKNLRFSTSGLLACFKVSSLQQMLAFQ